ncbi:DUF4832 domain-containing protein [Flavobacterium luteum]|uniref:DUF4832 domain-containing protein n=1 Tax=Flavobacterium luteum TaxID=2026654 RepID=A0A7J5AFZ7_9FLAO|nr:DUF4832 domain-containing protein [Flavobacterium luteum]KAB1156516.1 DUF4832 domain-containing protein [Flavobacterium luteum]
MKKLVLMLLTTVAMQSQTQNYTSSSEVFTNPERGWYKYSKAQSTTTFSFLSQSSLTSSRVNEKITLILRIYDLGAFKNTPISQTFLDNILKDFSTLRLSGVKAIVRFRYTEVDAIDATKAQIISHIEQLKTITVPNQDVISNIEAGFIGQYGEWYYTTNFGNNGVMSTQNLADRKEIGLKILELAPERMVSFRTPSFQNLIGGTTPITTAEAYNGSARSRIALHNDAFLSSSSDVGTFKNTSVEYPYLESQSKYTLCGGESNQLNSTYQNCTNAVSMMNKFHYNYLNIGYYGATLDLWKTSGCYDEVQRRLGYRFELLNSTITNNNLTINLQNVGFGNIFNQRKAFIVLRNTSTKVEYSFPINSDVRLWQSGTQTQITQSLDLDIPIGTYSLFLNLPDPKIANPLFSIQFANIGVWDAAKGYNNLNQTYTKSTSTVVITPDPIVITEPIVVEPVVTPTPVVVAPVVIAVINNSTITVSNLPTPTFTIQVYNLSGRVRSRSTDISYLKSGYYIVKVYSGGIIYTQKIYKV